jgi:hypothetical protein
MKKQQAEKRIKIIPAIHGKLAAGQKVCEPDVY